MLYELYCDTQIEVSNRGVQHMYEQMFIDESSKRTEYTESQLSPISSVALCREFLTGNSAVIHIMLLPH